jgi:hypothetical protein
MDVNTYAVVAVKNALKSKSRDEFMGQGKLIPDLIHCYILMAYGSDMSAD